MTDTITMSHGAKLKQFQSGKRIKLGVIANEFFDLNMGRMGGFGWATRQLAHCFNRDPSLGVEVVFLTGELSAASKRQEEEVHGCRLILRDKMSSAYLRRIWAEKFDLLMLIDYRPSYQIFCRVLPRTPIVTWVRDPRPPKDIQKINSVRIPGAEDILPQGLKSFDCTSFAKTVKLSKWFHRPVFFVTPALFLAEKIPETYGVKPTEVTLLPNIIDIEPGEVIKSEKPTVVFLARLDPYKRPWIFAELAYQFPDVQFIFLGQSHVHGKGAWEPSSLPENVSMMGHVHEEEKIRILSSAWVLVNTSIHEGLAVSFQEALKCETPILSCLDPEQVVSRFGIYIGRWDGSGMEGIPKFVEGLNQLLEDKELRIRLGKAGRKWVSETHSKSRFLESFYKLCASANIL